MKKSLTHSFHNILKPIFLANIFGIVFFSSYSFSESSPPNFPIIKNIGIIPIQWIGNENLLRPGLTSDELQTQLSQAIRQSGRYYVLADELTRQLWGTPDGRAELAQKYDLHAFASLAGYIENSMIRFEARFLSPTLETYIVETMPIALNIYQTSNAEYLKDFFQNLYYGIFNRVPVDVYITSVQEGYITLSGGELQNIQVGDRVDIVRPKLVEQHPSNFTWQDFSADKLGEAVVIEVKKYASVAKIESLVYDASIRVQDGAKIKHVPSRKFFVPPPPTVQENLKKSPVLLSQPKNNQDAGKRKPGEDQTTPNTDSSNSQVPQEDLFASNSGHVPLTTSEQNSQGPPTDFWRFWYENIRETEIAFGAHFWNATGAASASSNLPVWLVNSASLKAVQNTKSNEYIYRFNVGYGPTSKGSFLTFGGSAAVLFHDQISGKDSPVNRWYGGGQLRFLTQSITKESYGGKDLVLLSGVLGLNGQNLYEDGKSLDWRAQFSISPFGFGQLGASGSKKNVKSLFGWEIETAGFFVDRNSEWDWGGIIQYEHFVFELPKSSVNESGLKVLLAVRNSF